MKYFVYILKSKKNSDIYIGSTEDVQIRFVHHNRGRVKSTKAYRPWILLETKACMTRSEAVQLELFLKTGQQKEILRKKYGHVAN
jgi:putative endonuclease